MVNCTFVDQITYPFLKNEPASLNDIFGMMGGLMSALAPPKDAEGIILFNYLKLSLIIVF